MRAAAPFNVKETMELRLARGFAMIQIHQMVARWILLSGVAGVVLGFSGCGDKLPQTYAAKGKVTYKDGKPVKGGTIELVSKSDASVRAFAKIDETDGSFALRFFKDGKEKEGAAEGEYEVFIQLRGAGEDGGDGSRISVPGTVKIAPRDNHIPTIKIDR